MNNTLSDLRPDPKNRRAHNPRNIGMIRDALGEVGAARSIVIDEDNIVLAGNGVVEAAADAGIERVQIIDADGETIIAVRRSGLTDEQKRRLALYDNRAAELGTWDVDQIKADVEEGLSFEGLFYEAELAAINTVPYGDTSTNRDGQGVSSTWDQVKKAERDKLIMGDLEFSLDASVMRRVREYLEQRFQGYQQPYGVTMETLLIAGLDSCE